MSQEYNGLCISVKKDKNAHSSQCWVAYINNCPGGSEHTRGDSADDAVASLKERIDNYSTFASIYLRELSQEELCALEHYIRDNAQRIARILKKGEIIFPDQFPGVSFRAIYNHYKAIESVLNSTGETLELNIATICSPKTNIVQKVALFSVQHFDSPNKKRKLEHALRNWRQR